jgi:Fibronectin type III domain
MKLNIRKEEKIEIGSQKSLLLVGILAFVLSLCVSARASQSVTLAWNADTDPSTVGYALYYGTTNGVYSHRMDVGTNTTATVSGLTEGQTNYFAVSAYNAAGIEGPLSAPIIYIVPGLLKFASSPGASAPVIMQFPAAPGHSYTVQASTNMVSWTTLWQSGTSTSNAWVNYQDPQSGSFPKRFYRLILN